MASGRYPYPAELDSDDEGSIEVDWENDSQVDDDLTIDMDRLQIRGGSILCVVCKLRPRYNKNGKSYPTCGLTCASKLPPAAPSNSSSTPGRSGTIPGQRSSNSTTNRTPRRVMSQYQVNTSLSPLHQQRGPRPAKPLCVVCKARSVYRDYVTCSPLCIEKLFKDGPSDTTVCTYCHRRSKIAGKDQCGQTCADNAKVACLLCKVRPRNGKYHLCGKTCKRIATNLTPLILEIPKGHTTYDMVEQKFKSGWSAGSAQPTISKIYKIIENEDFLRPYDQYRQRVGPKESYRYHGTSRQCTLGVSTTKLCTSPSCSVCNILKTSFNVNFAKAKGAFGKGVYTSTASNKAFSFCGSTGAMLLTKVVLGKVRQVSKWNEVMSCPPGFNSVVFDRKVGTTNLNETIVYSNDAVRPVFLIIFQ